MSRKEIILLLFLLTCFTFFVQWTGAEQRSFFSLILAINNDQSLSIDRYESLTPDKALYNGHYYSDKAPGLPFLGLPVYAVLNSMQHLDQPGLLLPYSVYMVSAFVVSLPSALLALLVLRFLRRLGIDEGQAIATTLVMALGTLAFPFSTLFFSHQTAAFLTFASFYALFLAKSTPGQARLLFAAGLLVGAAVVVEYPMAIMALIFFLYALTCVKDKRRVMYYAAGGVPLALLLMAYNYACFDHPLRFSYFYETNTWAQLHQQGFLGLGMPQVSTLADILVGARGLLTLSPVLVLAAYGFWVMLRGTPWRAEGILFAASFGCYVLMTAGYKIPPTDIWVPGPRFIVPVLPFLAAPLAFSLRRVRWLFAVLAVISIAIMFLATAANPQAAPEIANPLFDYWLPGFLDRSQIVNTLPGVRFRISRARSIVVLAGVIGMAALFTLGAWLTRRNQRRQSAVLAGFLVAMLLAYLAFAFPVDLRQPFNIPRSLQGPTARAATLECYAGAFDEPS